MFLVLYAGRNALFMAKQKQCADVIKLLDKAHHHHHQQQQQQTVDGKRTSRQCVQYMTPMGVARSLKQVSTIRILTTVS